MPLVSIVAPTNRPPDVLEPCLRGFAAQQFDPRELEVLVVYNGVETVPAWPPDAWPFELIVDHIEQAHIGAAKNVALRRARGELVILVNDDVVPEPDFVAAHLAAHRGLDRPAMVLGRANWRRYEDETVLDCLVRNTSMIFFYDQMRPHEWYNYRHAWNLNLSIPRRHFAVEQFDERLGPFFYEDLELAYRLQERHGLRVWYAPEAAALHDHRYTLEGYFAREHAMGRAVVHLWECNADCYRATYGGDLDEACLEFCRRFVESEGRRGAELFDRLQQMVTRRPDELAPTPLVRHELIRLIYDAHLPLKRLAFRRGLLEASGVPIA